MELDLKKLLWSWIFLPLTALDWWAAWSSLPARVPMKFDANGHAIRWATREQALTFDLLFFAFFLGITSAVLFVAMAKQPEKARLSFAITTGANALIFAVLNTVLWRYQVP